MCIWDRGKTFKGEKTTGYKSGEKSSTPLLPEGCTLDVIELMAMAAATLAFRCCNVKRTHSVQFSLSLSLSASLY